MKHISHCRCRHRSARGGDVSANSGRQRANGRLGRDPTWVPCRRARSRYCPPSCYPLCFFPGRENKGRGAEVLPARRLADSIPSGSRSRERSCARRARANQDMAMACWCIALSAATHNNPAFQLLRDPASGPRPPPPGARAQPGFRGQVPTNSTAINKQNPRSVEAIAEAMAMMGKVTPRERLYIESAGGPAAPRGNRDAADAAYIATLRRLRSSASSQSRSQDRNTRARNRQRRFQSWAAKSGRRRTHNEKRWRCSKRRSPKTIGRSTHMIT